MVLDRLSHMPAKAMRNSSVLADLVREVGLTHDPIRPLYGRENISMHKRYGYGMFQLPEQVGCLLSELASLPTRMRTFVEVGAKYGWTGLFFNVFARRLFESSHLPQLARPQAAARARQDFRSASFDVVDERTRCVKALMARYDHAFHQIPRMHKPGVANGDKKWLELTANFEAAAAWYRERLAESFFAAEAAAPLDFGVGGAAGDGGASSHGTSDEKIDLCFIDGEHSFRHVKADVRFFLPRCRFLMFHDIVDGGTPGVQAVWRWLSSRLLQERDQRIKERTPLSDSTSWTIERGYFVKECTQQAGTRRWNFGLGIMSAERLNASWLDGPPSCKRVRQQRLFLPRGFKCRARRWR